MIIDHLVKLNKEFCNDLATPLTTIINASPKQPKCCTSWKTACVTPLPKSTNPESLNSLRPVAITLTPSLICESLEFDRSYVDITDSVDPQQCGNMKSSSATHCLVKPLDSICRNLEKRQTSVADFTATLDVVNHIIIIIIKKLVHLGLRARASRLMADDGPLDRATPSRPQPHRSHYP
ncbi:uncharacterized protein [Panulirus ornatus]|uniref:uncharacterized protein n=1 Tax=Panulirus ornatus TaxID=150431 RepID=UPI003A8604AC